MRTLAGDTPETEVPLPPVEKIQAGIDWITWVDKDPETRSYVHELGMELLHAEADTGAKVRPFGMEGYQGWTSGRVSIGSRPDSHLLRISGSLAATTWTRLQPSRGRPSRLDVQTSVLLTNSHGTFGRTLIKPLSAPSPRTRGRPLKRTIWQDSAQSWCGMVGSRTSSKYLRVYDKGIEQGTHPAGLYWRIELEAKRERARELWTELTKATDVADWSLKCCERACRSCLLSWPWPASSDLAPLPAASAARPPEVERSIRWLQQMVRPTIERLLPALGTEQILVLLGLDAYAADLAFFRQEATQRGME